MLCRVSQVVTRVLLFPLVLLAFSPLLAQDAPEPDDSYYADITPPPTARADAIEPAKSNTLMLGIMGTTSDDESIGAKDPWMQFAYFRNVKRNEKTDMFFTAAYEFTDNKFNDTTLNRLYLGIGSRYYTRVTQIENTDVFLKTYLSGSFGYLHTTGSYTQYYNTYYGSYPYSTDYSMDGSRMTLGAGFQLAALTGELQLTFSSMNDFKWLPLDSDPAFTAIIGVRF